MTTSGEAPLTERLSADFAEVEDGNDLHVMVGRAPFNGNVSAVKVITSEAITGADSNSRSVVVVNRGQAGAGTTVIAQLDFVSGVNTTAYMPKTVTLATTASQLMVTSGDAIDCFLSHVGTGITMVAGRVEVDVARD